MSWVWKSSHSWKLLAAGDVVLATAGIPLDAVCANETSPPEVSPRASWMAPLARKPIQYTVCALSPGGLAKLPMAVVAAVTPVNTGDTAISSPGDVAVTPEPRS